MATDRSLFLLATLPLLVCSGGSLYAQQPAGYELVEQLGSARFTEREAATRELLELGPAAIDALRHGIRSTDGEVRVRSQVLLRAARREARRLHIEEFRSGVSESLPHWDRFTAIVDPTPAARELFAEMSLNEPQLLADFSRDPLKAQHALELRCEEISRDPHSAAGTPSAVAALLFAASDPRLTTVGPLSSCLVQLTSQHEFRRMLAEPEIEPMLRALLAAWITTDRRMSARSRLQLATRFGLPEAVQPAVEILQAGDSGTDMLVAIQCLAKTRDPRFLDRLENLLQAETVLSRRRQNGKIVFETRLSDIALAALVLMTDQDPNDYGFTKATDIRTLLTRGRAGFPSDDARQAAMSRWHSWSREHLKAVRAVPQWAIEGITL